MESPDATTAQEDYLASMNHNDFLSAGSSFVKKLHIMVSTEMDDIIEWGADGTFFEIKDSRRLEIEVLPRYFRHARFQSLVRQLNFYDFKKISREKSTWVYSHDLFIRKKPEYLEYLRRKTNNSPTLPFLLNQKRLRERDTIDSSRKKSRSGAYRANEASTSSLTTSEVSTSEDDEDDSVENGPMYSSIFYKWDYICDIVQLPTVSELAGAYGVDQSQSRSESPSPTDVVHRKTLLSYCMDRNPYERPQTLIQEVRKMLRENLELAENFRNYICALHPGDVEDQDSLHSNYAYCVMKIQSNEILLMRTFLAYIVAQLHSSLSYVQNEEPDLRLRSTLRPCLEKWQTFVKYYN